MAFATGYLGDPQKVGAGERFGNNNTILSYADFEDGLKVGRFAKLDNGRLDNMDGSSTPVVAGVVLRNAAGPVEDGATVDATLYSQVDAMYDGLVTVNIVTGDTPSRFGLVYASNDGDDNDGLATTDTGQVPTGARFIQEVQSGVWLIAVTAVLPTAVTNVTLFNPSTYTVATTPDATTHAGTVIYVSNGAAGNPVLAISDGTDWIKLDGTGATISDGE